MYNTVYLRTAQAAAAAAAASFSMCERAHSAEEFDEWLERATWRQLRLAQTQTQRHSVMHALVSRYLASEELLTDLLPPGVRLACDTEAHVFSDKKSHQCDWKFEVCVFCVHTVQTAYILEYVR